MNDVYIGLGSNLHSPIDQLNQAADHLTNLPFIHDFIISPFYKSNPVGPQDQPDFVNAVAFFKTDFEALAILDTLQQIEHIQNRVREYRWGPRTIDLDILLYNDERIDLTRLTVPHPFMLERGFVIKPMSDLAPDLRLSNGQTVEQHLQQIDTSDLALI